MASLQIESFMKRQLIQAVCATGCAIVVLVGCSAVGANDSGDVRLDRFQQGLLDQVRKTLNTKNPRSANSCKPEQAELDPKLVDALMNRTIPLVAVRRAEMVRGEEVLFTFSRPTQRNPFGMTLIVTLVDERCSTFRLAQVFYTPPAPSGKS
jgi:hypothetical protein